MHMATDLFDRIQYTCRVLPGGNGKEPGMAGTKPDFVVHTNDPSNKDRYMEIGAGWSSRTQNGAEMISVSLDRRPFGEFSGKLFLFKRKEQEPPPF